jgi:hypothetical protein
MSTDIYRATAINKAMRTVKRKLKKAANRKSKPSAHHKHVSNRCLRLQGGLESAFQAAISSPGDRENFESWADEKPNAWPNTWSALIIPFGDDEMPWVHSAFVIRASLSGLPSAEHEAAKEHAVCVHAHDALTHLEAVFHNSIVASGLFLQCIHRFVKTECSDQRRARAYLGLAAQASAANRRFRSQLDVLVRHRSEYAAWKETAPEDWDDFDPEVFAELHERMWGHAG